ncbi:MAG: microcin C ABC transporter permease YejB [Hyphomicrobiales bacterium]|nr:microcin C ABC transporter permease YejB [Hyphomicrobiales bacterium]MDE2017926.1 microcin C ABC transporter permease YejB [Hyphomicrobiales bacterium]
MAAYLARRLLFMLPTIFGIMLVSFVVVQFAPGGPVERVLEQLRNPNSGGAAGRIGGGGGDLAGGAARAGGQAGSLYRGSEGLDPKFVAELNRQFGYDKPAPQRFWMMIRDYSTFNFGKSWFAGRPVIDLIRERLPVSISLGLWMTLLSYAVSIPLGIAKAVRDGSRFDAWTSAIVIVGYAIPSFLFALFLVLLFAGGSFFQVFPLRGLTSDDFAKLSPLGKVLDYAWHVTLPVIAMSIGAFATTTFLTKNSFLEEIRKTYVQTARMKGLPERRVLYGHVFRNAMLVVIAGFPAAFVGAFFEGALLIENVFSLDGLGYLSYQSIMNRDYPVVFASLFVFALVGLAVNLLSDLIYAWIDPRIDFATRGR